MVITRAMSRKMARPSSSPMPSGQKTTASADGDDGEDQQADEGRARSSGRGWAASPEAMMREQPVLGGQVVEPARAATPTAMQPASRHSPSWPAIQNAATTRTSGDQDGLALVAQDALQDRRLLGRLGRGASGVGDSGWARWSRRSSRHRTTSRAGPRGRGPRSRRAPATMPRKTPTSVNAGAVPAARSSTSPSDRADDDAAGEETAEPDEVATTQSRIEAHRRRSAHRPFTQVASVAGHRRRTASVPDDRRLRESTTARRR